MSELLIEIYSEEIPSRMQVKAMDDFKKIFVEFFNKQSIKFSEEKIKIFITPRRLTLLLEDLSPTQTIPAVDKIGPKIDAPLPAIQGFLKSVAVDDVAKLETVNRDNGQYYFYKQPEVKINTAQILEKQLPAILQKMLTSWPKTMEVINLKNRHSWVRPIRSILAIFDNQILNFEFANLKTSNQTFGHLLSGKKLLTVTNFADYEKQLADNLVVLDWFKRREIIVNGIRRYCEELFLNSDAAIHNELILKNSKLIDEITGLVEYPQVLIGNIDQRFADLPIEVLELTIKLHQKAILVQSKESLKFIFVSNVKADDVATKKIITDNEKVVRARLEDAKFFIEEDLKIPFLSRTELLKNIIFHEKLGSLYDKVKRLEDLNKLIVPWVKGADLASAQLVANLSKNDLTTKTVAELTELQGIIGSYYAAKQNQPAEISAAIAEQYLPTGQNSPLPESRLGIVMAMSDKIDNIVGLFFAGEKPTASKDPFALRRAALGVVKILLVENISLPLRVVVDHALKIVGSESSESRSKLSTEIINFFIERTKAYLKDQHLKADVINEIFDQATCDERCDLLVLTKKAEFISGLVFDQKNHKIIELYKRANNIVNIEQKRDKKEYHHHLLPMLTLEVECEKTLYDEVKLVEEEVGIMLKNNHYNVAFNAIGKLEPYIINFFDNVEVNCLKPSLRENRLLLLAKIRSLFNQIFDFSKIEIS